jgi:hypothetical protein
MSFWHVKIVDVDHQTKYIYDYVKGTQDLHCVKYVNIHDVNKMLKKDLSCFLFLSWLQIQGLHEFGLDQGMASKGPKYEQLSICF